MQRPEDPLWTDEDMVLALQWTAVESEKCGGCGQPIEESFKPQAQYTAHALTCQACRARELKSADWTDPYEAAGVKFSVSREKE